MNMVLTFFYLEFKQNLKSKFRNGLGIACEFVNMALNS